MRPLFTANRNVRSSKTILSPPPPGSSTFAVVGGEGDASFIISVAQEVLAALVNVCDEIYVGNTSSYAPPLNYESSFGVYTRTDDV